MGGVHFEVHYGWEVWAEQGITRTGDDNIFENIPDLEKYLFLYLYFQWYIQNWWW